MDKQQMSDRVAELIRYHEEAAGKGEFAKVLRCKSGFIVQTKGGDEYRFTAVKSRPGSRVLS